MEKTIFNRSLPSMLLEARESTMRIYRRILDVNNISELQWRILRIVVEEGAMSASKIAERGYVPMPSLSRTLRTLEKQKLVKRDWDSTDRRRVIIRATARGISLYSSVWPKIEAQNLRFEKLLTFKKKKELYEMLQYLADVANEAAINQVEDTDSP